jgi:hypothetical protein
MKIIAHHHQRVSLLDRGDAWGQSLADRRAHRLTPNLPLEQAGA